MEYYSKYYYNLTIMSKIGFIVDSASGIKNGQFPNVHVIPLVITVKDDSGNVKEYLDGVNVTEAEIAADIKKGYDVKTSQAAVGVLMQEIEKIQDQYDKIYVMPIQPKISSSYNTWMMIKDDYPKLVILPTTDFTCGCIWKIEHWIDLANKDQLTDEVAMDYIKNIHKKRNGILFVYDLNQLVKGGRISNFKAFFAKLFKLKIVISADDAGLNFIDKSRSFSGCVKCAFDYFKRHNPEFEAKNVIRLGLIYSATDRQDPEIQPCIEAIKAELKDATYKTDEYIFPNVLMAHTGGDMFAFYIEFK